MYDPFTEFNLYRLPNGLDVHHVQWDRPWVKVGVLVHAGSREDPANLPGLAHFVEHMVGRNIPSYEFKESKEFFEDHGGSANFGGTGYLSTHYSFSLPMDTGVLSEAFLIFGSMLLDSKLVNDLEQQRSIIHQEFNRAYDYPDRAKWLLKMRSVIMKGHRAETWLRPIGYPKGFLLTRSNDLQEYYDRYYVPANISLVFIGGIDWVRLEDLLFSSPFSKTKPGSRVPVAKPFTHLSDITEHGQVVKWSDLGNLKKEKTEYDARWALSGEFSQDLLVAFCMLLNDVLFEEIREKHHLSYDFRSSLMFYQDAHELRVSGDINSEATDRINDLVELCVIQVVNDKRAFERIIEVEKRQLLMLDLNGAGMLNISTNDLAKFQHIRSIRDELNGTESISFEDIQRVGRSLCPERRYSFVACP